MKVLFVGDLHLRERELSTTKGMITASQLMLEGIRDYLLANEDVKMVVFEGDIQHDTPKSQRTLRETTIWKSLLQEIGGIIQNRIGRFILAPRKDTNTEKQTLATLPLFTVKGNHDVEKTLRSVRSDYNYTFFDDLIYTGILQNPRGIMVKESGRYFYIQLNNYGEADYPIDSEVQKAPDFENIKKIKVLHDTVKVPSSPSWIDLMSEGTYYIGEDILGDSDIAICGHIHEPLAQTVVQGNGKLGNKQTIFLQTGAMGRTSFTDDNMRDFGYCTTVDLTNDMLIEEVQIPLNSVEDYFNWKQISLNESKKEAIKQGQMFSLDFGQVTIERTDPKQDIENLENVSESVKENCISALENIESEGN